ncbi:S8 family serine peptidase [Nonomuraea sp. LPB2021202275-12-8]|uniref:S8 family serine peptidase n=1 Tax=Nonomuraea sp. LPB2021202275-12-8 TaxID=3120159 RepID=UPI00300D62A4
MPRRFGLPSVYLAAAVVTAAATAVTTTVPLAMTPASGLAGRPQVTEPTRPYIVTARDRAAARDLVGEMRWRVRRYYTAALPGFATWLSAAEEAELRADPRVQALEPDRQIHPMNGRRPAVAQTAGGKGVTVYVVDSGVDITRGEFGERAWRAFDATGGTGQDCTGHGTQVAHTVAGRSYGVAPQARIASVRVLGCGGSGTLSDVLAGLDWVRRHARGPAVTNLSLDGADSPALDTATRGLVRSGVFVTAAADSGACRTARGGQAYSAAAPQLAGAAARHLELHPDTTPSFLASSLNCTTARGGIRQNPSRTSNLLLRGGGL